MGDRNMRLVYSSGVSQLVERNASFDSGVLRVAYSGRNRNNSFISKQTFERCIGSMYNCPVVCNYDRDSDSIGAHDAEVVKDDNGYVRIVNVTQPVGVVPESARYWWEEIEDDSGVHEYLCTDVLIWKRQEAYNKIKDNEITDESMEITVKEGQMRDGVFVIDDFEFTAFCLLGSAEPCFESASLEMFSKSEFQAEFAEMAKDLKELLNTMQASNEDGISTENYSEGGEKALEEKMALVAEFGIDLDSIDFAINDFTVDELREKFEAMQQATAPATEEPEVGDEQFALEGQFREELIHALESGEQVETVFGEMPRYWYCDYDKDLNEVYGYDETDWNLYGFAYSLDGDHIVIDFDSKKRMKIAFVPFDEGSQVNVFAKVFNIAFEKFNTNNAEWEEKYNNASEAIAGVNAELETLREFKKNAEDTAMNEKRNEILSQFESLNGIEAFDTLREHCAEYDLETLEEKCYALRGRFGMGAKYALDQKAPKISVDHQDIEKVNDARGNSEEPYGGIFEEYGFSKPE